MEKITPPLPPPIPPSAPPVAEELLHVLVDLAEAWKPTGRPGLGNRLQVDLVLQGAIGWHQERRQATQNQCARAGQSHGLVGAGQTARSGDPEKGGGLGVSPSCARTESTEKAWSVAELRPGDVAASVHIGAREPQGTFWFPGRLGHA